ncbi:MAG: efflux RND transporter permease subunit [Bradymonadales bacterium]|nr:MAG: efflux RND transporter permease subunit [Bradymonadales bacterium]
MLKSLYSQSLLANLLTPAIFVIGLITLVRLPLEVFPSVNYDVVSITTVFPGASPEQVERLVTNPIEDEVKTVFGIRDLFSTSIEGLSTITVVLDQDYRYKSEVVSDIQRAVDRVEALPAEITDRPLVQELKSDREPSILVALVPTGEMSSSFEPSLEHRELALALKREFENIRGVGEVRLEAEQDLEFIVSFDVEKLRAAGVSIDEIVSAFRLQNLSVPAGEREFSSGVVRYRIENELTNTKVIGDVILRASIDGQIFRVRDLAEISIGLKKATYYSRASGQPAQVLQIIKQQSADVLDVVDELKEVASGFLDRVNTASDQAWNWEVVYGRDLTIPVRVRNEALATSILIGGILVFLVLLLALHWRTAVIVAIGIPFSFLGAIILMPGLDYSLNLLTMFGFVVVLGMIVDDAIVVAEAIFSRMEKGESRDVAVVEGTASVLRPVLGSVATTIFAFAPLVMMSGIFGQFVKFIPMVVILCLLVSLVEAFFLLPNHMRDFAKIPSAEEGKRFHWFDRLRDFYRSFLKHCVRFRYFVLVGGLVFIVLAGDLHKKMGSFVLFPREGIDTVMITFEGRPELSVAEMAERIRPVEEALTKFSREDVLSVMTSLGLIQTGGQETRRTGTNYAQVTVNLSPSVRRELEVSHLIRVMTPVVEEVPDMLTTSIEEAAGGPPVGRPVSIILTHDSFEVLEEVAAEILQELASIEGTRNVSDSNLQGKFEAIYEIDFLRALQAGVSTASVGLGLQMLVEGAVIQQIRGENERMGLRLKLKGDEAPEELLSQLSVLSRSGELLPLDRLLKKVDSGSGRYSIKHYQGQRSISVYADVETSIVTASRANQLMETRFSEWKTRFPGLKIYSLGENRDTQESFESLKEALTFALIGVIFVVILTLGSLWLPLVVLMSSVPLGVAGVLIVFVLDQRPLSFLAAFGIVGFIGVAVNVGIVLVDRIQKLTKELPYREALIEGSVERLRAVLLTSVTTVFGLMPTAYGWGGGDPFLQPMALALGWGVAFATLSGIVFTPVILAVGDDILGIFGKGSLAKK